MQFGTRFKPWVGGQPDWRGWITLVWVLWWAWAYGIMAIQARAPLVSAWVRSWASGH